MIVSRSKTLLSVSNDNFFSTGKYHLTIPRAVGVEPKSSGLKDGTRTSPIWKNGKMKAESLRKGIESGPACSDPQHK